VKGFSRFSLLAFVLLFVGCGIQVYVYFDKPDLSLPSSNLLELDPNPLNYDTSDSSFKGYEIFYRIYDDQEVAESDIGLLDQHNGYIGDSYLPGEFVSYATNTLGFARLRKSTDNKSPLISITSDSGSPYYIQLNVGTDWILDLGNINNSADDIATVVRSNATDSTRVSFYKKAYYQKNDSDYEGESSPSQVYFVFFAVAYGVDSTSFEDVYSEPSIILTPAKYSPGF